MRLHAGFQTGHAEPLQLGLEFARGGHWRDRAWFYINLIWFYVGVEW